MSDNNFTDVIIEDAQIGASIFSMLNLKYYFFAILIISFLVMSCGKSSTDRRMRLLSQRRKIVQVWTSEKRDKIKDLSKKSVDIKDFRQFKPSDIENITALNTLINSYISKMYEEIKPCLSLNKTAEDENSNYLRSETANEEGKNTPSLAEGSISTSETPYLKEGVTTTSSESRGVAPPSNSTNNNSEGYLKSGEMEQGTERNFCGSESKDFLSGSPREFHQKRSILKTQKNVSFNLSQNKVKFI